MGRMNKPEKSPREIALENAKITNPKFANFIDRLMLLTGVMIRADGSGGEDILDEDCLENLILAPIPRRGGAQSTTDIVKQIDDVEDDSDASSSDDDDESDTDGSSSSEDEK
eukprot:4633363-Ditylum_brightwellii.AAC.1